MCGQAEESAPEPKAKATHTAKAILDAGGKPVSALDGSFSVCKVPGASGCVQ